MKIEEIIFEKAKLDFNKLLKYGFIKEEDKYFYEKNILDGTFKIIVEINEKENVNGKVIDLEFNSEYNNFRVESANGKFTSKVKDEFIKVLKDIKGKCFNSNYFISDQANRICNLITEKYDNKPEFLWEKYPNYGVFRNNKNKWYAIIMNILGNKIDDRLEKIDIINVKLKEDKITNLLKRKGFFKAYHMNKKNWITIVLDNTITDDEIMNYINESYSLTNK